MKNKSETLRPKAGVRALCITIYIAGVALLTAHLPLGIPDHHRIWLVPVFALFGAFWLANVLTTRIVLDRDSMHIVSISDFQSRTIPRIEIDSATWEKSGSVSIKLRDGKWVRLPNIVGNAQELTKTIRAWLRRTGDC